MTCRMWRVITDQVKKLHDCMPISIIKYILRTPNRPVVVSKMRYFQILHFACHRQSFLGDPSQSCLFLNDWKTTSLTVSDITALNLDNSQFAYLSVCHASVNRDERLLDEAIHVAEGCQLAGFPYVVGALLQIEDLHSANFARDVYTQTLEKGSGIDVTKSAETLHHTTRTLRDETRHVAGVVKLCQANLSYGQNISCI